MGLAEKISQAQAERKAEEQNRLDSLEATEKLCQDAENAKLQAKALKAIKADERKAALLADLTTLFDVVGAREQLAEVEKVWQVGEFDTTPQQISDIGWMFEDRYYNSSDYDFSLLSGRKQPVPGLGLALRYRYTDIEEYVEFNPGDPTAGELGSPSSGARMGTTVYECEARLYTIVGFTEKRIPFVATVYGQHQLNGTTYTKDGTFRPFIHDYFDRMHNALSYNKPETILPENPQLSREILERQLVALCKYITNPLDLENKAKGTIATDVYLPNCVKERFDPKSTFSRQPAVSPLSWYRKLFT
ncbi:MAG: hypothetical protein PHE48_02805 [Candidatus Daviesbacteria bacterium]|nr:hypothetical protein [Candidatus Daviesbacteria bacterium]